MFRRRLVVLTCLLLGHGALASQSENLNVLPEAADGVSPADMMKHYLSGQISLSVESWRREYEQLKTPEQIAQYQKRLRKEFIEAIGGLPQRTPLNARVTGVVYRDGYRVEKVIFESQPKHFVTAALFLPDSDRFSPPYPGVLEPVGHSFNAKAGEGYQKVAALLALNGMAALVFDPIEQGERGQLMSEWPRLWGTRAHTMIGVGSILLGRNTARFEIWDGMRAIDYLLSRPEINPKRIGCAGLSGGGTQTSYLMALDDRIVAAAPACYLTSLDALLSTIGPQDAEQNIFGQLRFGMDHADYMVMRAPKPTLICAATQDFFDISGTWASLRYAKRIYSRLRFAERIDLIEHDGEHGYHQPLREATTRWMMRWLLGKDKPITEPEIKMLSEEEMQCTPDGQAMLLEGARSTYDLNRDYGSELAERRKRLWETADTESLLQKVRETASIRKLTELPQPEVREVGVTNRDRYRIKKIIIQPEDNIYLPALMFVPDRAQSEHAVLYVHEEGKSVDAAPGGPIEKSVKEGLSVLAVDLRGTGETQRVGRRDASLNAPFGADWKDVYTAYLLGRSYVGMRTEDVLVCARWLAQRAESVDLIAIGNVGVPALHAAALEPDLFGSVKLVRTLICWSDVIRSGTSTRQLLNVVHGALRTYDLPNLAGVLGDKLTVEQPTNSMGELVQAGQSTDAQDVDTAQLRPEGPATTSAPQHAPSAKAKAPASKWPAHIQIVLDSTEPLQFDRGERLPLYLWQAIDPGQLDEESATELVKKLDERGVGLIASWDPRDREKSLARSLTIAEAQKRLGLRININATGCLYSFFNGDERTAHIDEDGKPFWDDSFGKNKMGCPFALGFRVPFVKEQVDYFAGAFKKADLDVGFVFADWEIDGPIEFNKAHTASKRCRRCRESIENIEDFSEFQKSLRTLRSQMQRQTYAEPLKENFPKVLVGNYGVYPHNGYRYWYDYYEYYVDGQPCQVDQRAKYRKWYHEFPETGYTFAMPVAYPWQRIFDWYDYADTDYRWFYNMLRVASNAGENTPADIPIISFVHWHTVGSSGSTTPAKQFSAANYKELLWHMLLRGTDTFFLWSPQTQAAKEIPLVHQVYSEAQQYGRFLSEGSPISFTVPRQPRTVISGLRLADRVLLRRTDFGSAAGPVGIGIGDSRLEIPESPGQCQIISLE